MVHLRKRNGHLLRTGATGVGHLVRSCGTCSWSFFDCRLFWWHPTPPAIPFTAKIITPSTTVELLNVQGGVIPDGLMEDGEFCIEFIKDAVVVDRCCVTITNCTPVNPCCVKTVGIYGIVSGIPATEVGRGTIAVGSPGFTYGGNQLWIFDHYAANVSWNRGLEFAPGNGPKTDSNCYDRIIAGEVLLGTGSETHCKMARNFGQTVPSCWDESEIPNFQDGYKEEISFDIYLNWNHTGGNFRVKTIGECTAYTLTTYGSPGHSAPPAITVGTRVDIIRNQSLAVCNPSVVLGTIPRHSMKDVQMTFYDSPGCANEVESFCNLIHYPELAL